MGHVSAGSSHSACETDPSRRTHRQACVDEQPKSWLCFLHRLPADSAGQEADINRAGSHASAGRTKFWIVEAAAATGLHT